MRNRLLLVALAVLCLLVSSRPAPSFIRALTIEDRVEAQRAIEEVYWSHRIWPAENRSTKPPLSAVMSDAALRSRVEDYLKKSNALAAVWGRPITSQQLQAEMERMARHTQASDVLSELFAALGSDPVLIAETLVRQKLVDRRLRDAYAYDERFHGRVRRSAEGALSRVRRVADLKTLGGEYRETTWRLSDRADSRAGRDHRHLRELAGKIHARAGSSGWSRLEETADSFTVPAILSEESTAVTTATVSWPKVSFEAWWSKERNTLGTSLAEGVGSYAAVQPRGTACVDDTWRKTFDADIPDGRGYHTAVWTGTEMIIWGGFVGLTPMNTGGRYDPTTDTWTPTSTGAGVPEGRGGQTAVWTGTKMIVWGGSTIPPYNPGFTLNTGGLYDPSTDTWEPTSTGANVPQGRASHTAVWTGSRMIVWGGTDQHPLNSGGRYDPSTNTWASTSTGVGVPSARPSHTAVWTGTKMIIWGGGDLVPFKNTGGRYDPSTDTWTATSTGASVPESRAYHTAVWTGTEMIVWGGLDAALDGLNTGGRYDPSTDTWAATSTGAGVPQGRGVHTAVWTGSRMIVWGGYVASILNTGGRYDPSTNTWEPTSTGAGVPRGRGSHTAVWTGSEMIVWGGGSSFTELNSGGRYDPATDTWAATSAGTGIPTGRSYGTAIWTGVEMIVWGGYDGRALNTGGRYDPATDTWAATSTGASVPASRLYHTAVWTGTEMIVWGGYDDVNQVLSTGGRYNPSLDAWTATSTGAVPSDRGFHTAVWTGTEMIVWGGGGEDCCDYVFTNTGGRYNPSLDSWSATSTGAGVPSDRGFHTAVWTGTEMIVWGGRSDSNFVNTGGRYDPSTNTWAVTSTGAGVPSPRSDHTAVWTGAEMIAWGGADPYDLNTGGRYYPLTDTWAATSTAAGVPSGRARVTAVWTGMEMIIWGGYAGASYFNTGGRYDPALDTWMATSTGAGVPSERALHTAVWTGTEMIVWGGDPISARGGRYCASVSCMDVPTMCDDGYACTSDACDAGTGQCVNTPIVCNDGNVCNGVETCNPATGCVSGTPVVCALPDQCQAAGVCAPGTGVCSYADKPNGSTCDDGNAGTTGDACVDGVCAGSSCDSEPKPKSSGYYKKLCKAGEPKPSHGNALSDADAACVGASTDTFAGISTATDICVVFQNSNSHDSDGPDCKECEKAEDELMALALNICRQNVCGSQEVDSACGTDHDSHHRVLTTVGASVDTADDILSDPARSKETCKEATCLAKEVNNGKGIHHVSLTLGEDTGGQIRLNWLNPVMDDGSGEGQKYTIWRRVLNADESYTKITETTNLTWVDANPGTTSWEYEVTFTVQP